MNCTERAVNNNETARPVFIPYLAQRTYQESKIFIFTWINEYPRAGRALFLPLSISLGGCNLVFGVAHIIESFAYTIINLVGLLFRCSGTKQKFFKDSITDLLIGGPALLLAAPLTILWSSYNLLLNNQFASDSLKIHQNALKSIQEKLEAYRMNKKGGISS